MPREIMWTDAEEIGIQLQEKYPDLDPLTVLFTDLHKYVTELEGFADDPAKSNEGRLEAIQMAWHEEFEDAKGYADNQSRQPSSHVNDPSKCLNSRFSPGTA